MTLPRIPALASVAAGAVALLPAASVFDVSDYGAVGDDVTDDTAAIQAAVDAAVAWADANDGQATVYWPTHGPYVVSGQVVIPYRDETVLDKITLWFKGSGPLTPNHGAVTGGTVIRSTLTGASYDATYGWPAVFRGADFDKVVSGNGKFSAYHVVIEDVYTQVPANPSLAAWNLSGTATCEVVGNAGAGVAVLPVASAPTNPTGVGILWPQGDNHAVIRGAWYSAGFYAAAVLGEHLRGRLFAYQCFIGAAFRNYPGGHGLSLDAQIEWCTYAIAGIDPVTGVQSPTPSANFGQAELFVRFEDGHAGSPAWTLPVAHVRDINGAIRASRLRCTRWVSGSGAVPTPLILQGGNFTVENLVVTERSVFLRKSFIGANSALVAGPTETGQSEQALSGTWGIQNNTGYLATAAPNGNYFDVWESSAADAEMTALLMLSPNRAGPFVVFRATDVNNWLAVQLYKNTANGSDEIALYRNIAGTISLVKRQLAAGLVLGRPYLVRIRYVGSNIAVWVHGPGRTEPFALANSGTIGQETATKVGIGNSVSATGDDNLSRYGPLRVRQAV